MAASDWAYYDEDRQSWGYWVDDGATWVPLSGNPAHRSEW